MKLATPSLQIFISDSGWPNMEVLVVTDTGREFTGRAMFDIASSQLTVPVTNALQIVLTDAIAAAKDRAR